MSLSPGEIADIEKIVKSGRLKQVRIEQGGESVVIGDAAPAAEASLPPKEAIAITAPAVGTLSLGATRIGTAVTKGDAVAALKVLDAELPILAPASGTVRAVLAEDSDLIGFGREVILIEPEDAA